MIQESFRGLRWTRPPSDAVAQLPLGRSKATAQVLQQIQPSPRDCYWGDTASYRTTRVAPPALSASSDEKVAAALAQPTNSSRAWPRLAFALYVVTAVAPVVGCTMLVALAANGLIASVPALAMGVALFAVTTLGTLVVKFVEDWESRPRRQDRPRPSERAAYLG